MLILKSNNWTKCIIYDNRHSFELRFELFLPMCVKIYLIVRHFRSSAMLRNMAIRVH
jgi:hypothetical protein